MIIDNHFHRIISNFGYRLRALEDTPVKFYDSCFRPASYLVKFNEISTENLVPSNYLNLPSAASQIDENHGSKRVAIIHMRSGS